MAPSLQETGTVNEVVRSGSDLISLLIVFFSFCSCSVLGKVDLVLVLVGVTSSKKPKALLFQI